MGIVQGFLSDIGVGLVLSALAALFAYLGWVRMTTKRRTDVQETLSSHFEGLGFRVGEYRAHIANVTVTAKEGPIVHLRNNLIPGGRYGSNAKLWLEIENFYPDSSYIVRVGSWPDYGISDIETHNNGLILEFDTTDEEIIREQLEDLDGLFDEIVSEFGTDEDS